MPKSNKKTPSPLATLAANSAAKISGSNKSLAEAIKPEPKPKRAASGAAAQAAAKKQATEAAQQAAKEARLVKFESRDKEPSAFEVAGISPTRDFSSGRLIWSVDKDDVDRFVGHHHVQTGRVVRAASSQSE